MDMNTTLSAIKAEIFAAMIDDKMPLHAAVRIVARYEAAARAQASPTRRDELAGGAALDVARQAYRIADEMIKRSKL